jgi:hypothetical protein
MGGWSCRRSPAACGRYKGCGAWVVAQLLRCETVESIDRYAPCQTLNLHHNAAQSWGNLSFLPPESSVRLCRPTRCARRFSTGANCRAALHVPRNRFCGSTTRYRLYQFLQARPNLATLSARCLVHHPGNTPTRGATCVSTTYPFSPLALLPMLSKYCHYTIRIQYCLFGTRAGFVCQKYFGVARLGACRTPCTTSSG